MADQDERERPMYPSTFVTPNSVAWAPGRSRKSLPHLEKAGCSYFVTFCLHEARLSGNQDALADFERITGASEPLGGGSVGILENREIAEIVEETLLHFQGERYILSAWCVMPDHVHVVVTPLDGRGLASILHSWKSFTANEINKLLKRQGEIRHPEYYDHLIRDENDFRRCLEYTYYNPEKAGIETWKWRGCVGCEDDGRTDRNTGILPVHGQDGHGTETFGPEDVFDYMYAVFHSPTYRSRYAEFLKIDFPRLPLTSKKKLFRKLCALGEELVNLHLMEKHGPEMTAYPVNGDHLVDKIRYKEPDKNNPKGRVWINKTQYFEGVPPEVWEFHVGGYQVCRKWLKDRKGRNLTYDDQKHYQHIVSALSETIRLMSEIDKAIDNHGGWPIE